MRVLLLGNSNDGGDWLDGGRKRHEIVRDRLAETYGEPVEVITKAIWPRPGIAAVVDGWVEKYKPDIIYLTMAAFWFQYQSVPLRVRRLLGPLGPRASNAGFKLAESPRWAYNRVFRGARRGMQMTVGGDTHFSPDEVVERVSEVIGHLLRNEGITLAIQGADGRTNYAHSRRGAARNEARRQRVHLAMQAFCRGHHVTYENSELPLWATDPELSGNRVGDGLHANARWHEHSAELIYLTIRHAIESSGSSPVSPDKEAAQTQ